MVSSHAPVLTVIVEVLILRLYTFVCLVYMYMCACVHICEGFVLSLYTPVQCVCYCGGLMLSLCLHNIICKGCNVKCVHSFTVHTLL